MDGGNSGSVAVGADDLSLRQVFAAGLRHRRILVLVPAVFAILFAIVTLLLPPSFTTTLSFAPQASAMSSSQLVGLAAQFGVSLSGQSATQSTDFYAAVVVSPEIVRPLAESTYVLRIDEATTRLSFVDIYRRHLKLVNLGSSSYGDDLRDAMDEIANSIDVSSNTTTGLVSVSVQTRWPDLSFQLATNLVQLVNRLDERRRRAQAAAESEFIAEQARLAEAELRSAEDRSEAFLQANRSYQSDPALALRFDRLQRDVLLKQTLYTSIAQAFAQARIEVARNTPAVTAVEQPRAPLVPDKRHILIKMLLGFFFGVALAVTTAFVREIARQPQNEGDVELAELKSAAIDDLRAVMNPARWFRRRNPAPA